MWHCRYCKHFIIHRQQSISCYTIKHIQRILVFTLRCIQVFFNFRLRALIRSKCPQSRTGTHSHIRHTCEGRYPLPRRDLFPHAHFHFVIPASRPILTPSSFPRRRESIAPQGHLKHYHTYSLFVILAHRAPLTHSSFPHIAPTHLHFLVIPAQAGIHCPAGTYYCDFSHTAKIANYSALYHRCDFSRHTKF